MSQLKFTKAAHDKIVSTIQSQNDENRILRIEIAGRSLKGFTYDLSLEAEKDQREGDVAVDLDDFRVRLGSKSAKDLAGASVDWVENVTGSGFKIENPNPPMPHLAQPRAIKVQELLDSEINPSLASHGGAVEFVDLLDSKLVLKMSGGCQGCGMAAATLRQGIEVRIKEVFPEITEVVDATDHAAGENPYFK